MQVANNGGSNAIAVAEHAIALLLSYYRRMPEAIEHGIPTPLAPYFLGHFSPVLRRLFPVILRFPASWRQDGENGRKMA